MKFFTKNVKIALTVLAGLALLYWGINYLKGINLLTPANSYYTEVESSEGLLTAAPITVEVSPCTITASGFRALARRIICLDFRSATLVTVQVLIT